MNPGITVTGADERTPLVALRSLVALGAEIGLLYTFDPEGRPRYPGHEWILATTKTLKRSCALHVCGGRARTSLLLGHLDSLLANVGRVQVNGHLFEEELHDFRRVCGALEIITQHTQKNSRLAWCAVENHSLLVDGSGGRGLLPEQWERPGGVRKPVGFAGGLGPDTLFAELPKIRHIAQAPWWVDCESSLRDSDDWFDPLKALAVVRIFRAGNGT